MIKSPGDFDQYLQNLIDRHPRDLSIILNGLGVDLTENPVEPKTLVLAFLRFGDRFTNALRRLPEDHFNGIDWKGLFNKGIELITSGSDDQSPTGPAPEEDEKKWSTKSIIIAGIITVVILITILVIVKKSK